MKRVIHRIMIFAKGWLGEWRGAAHEEHQNVLKGNGKGGGGRRMHVCVCV